MMMTTMMKYALSVDIITITMSIAIADATTIIIMMAKVKQRNMASEHTFTTAVSPST